MDKFTARMFCALRASECVIVDGLLVKTFQLEGPVGGGGILSLEDGSVISFANQELTIIGGYSAFHTEAEKAHSIDFIGRGRRGLCEADLQPPAPAINLPQAALNPLQLRPSFRPH
jgi:hypothetical protein